MANQPARKTYFGVTALITGIFAVLFISANVGVSYLRITPAVFGQLNIFTAQTYCVLTPLAFGLGLLGLVFKNDSKLLAGLGIAVVAVPFLVILVQLVLRLTN
jgi:hypothetical protein